MNDKIVGFMTSVLVHGAIFAAGAAVLVKAPQFGVDVGTSGIEVSLVAAPVEPLPLVERIEEPLPDSVPDEVKPQTPTLKEMPPVPSKVVKTDGKDKINFKSSGGAISEAKPDYFKNPAPPYPLQARQKGWSGTVVLKVLVDKKGEPGSIEIEQSSGHSSLDEAALKAVKKWKFRPAMLGNMPVESSVRIPVRFDLERY